MRDFYVLSEKWILCFFHSDGRGSAMSRINDCLVRKDEKTAANMLYQFVEVATCKVGAADTALEQDIAGEHTVVFFAIIHQATGRVSGYMDCFQLGVSESDDITIMQIFP